MDIELLRAWYHPLQQHDGIGPGDGCCSRLTRRGHSGDVLSIVPSTTSLSIFLSGRLEGSLHVRRSSCSGDHGQMLAWKCVFHSRCDNALSAAAWWGAVCTGAVVRRVFQNDGAFSRGPTDTRRSLQNWWQPRDASLHRTSSAILMVSAPRAVSVYHHAALRWLLDVVVGRSLVASCVPSDQGQFRLLGAISWVPRHHSVQHVVSTVVSSCAGMLGGTCWTALQTFSS